MIPEIVQPKYDTDKQFSPNGPYFSTTFLVHYFHAILELKLGTVSTENDLLTLQKSHKSLGMQQDFQGFVDKVDKVVELTLTDRAAKVPYELFVTLDRFVNSKDGDELKNEHIPNLLVEMREYGGYDSKSANAIDDFLAQKAATKLYTIARELFAR